MTTITPAPLAESGAPLAEPGAQLAEPVAQLRIARQLVRDRFGPGEPLAEAALNLIDCAARVVHHLPGRDLDAARDALDSARAAVVAATFAVQRVHDSTVEQA
jgi:hypothetical protein